MLVCLFTSRNIFAEQPWMWPRINTPKSGRIWIKKVNYYSFTIINGIRKFRLMFQTLLLFEINNWFHNGVLLLQNSLQDFSCYYESLKQKLKKPPNQHFSMCGWNTFLHFFNEFMFILKDICCFDKFLTHDELFK